MFRRRRGSRTPRRACPERRVCLDGREPHTGRGARVIGAWTTARGRGWGAELFSKSRTSLTGFELESDNFLHLKNIIHATTRGEIGVTPEGIRVSEEPGGSWWQATVQVAGCPAGGGGRQMSAAATGVLRRGRLALQVGALSQVDGKHADGRVSSLTEQCHVVASRAE